MVSASDRGLRREAHTTTLSPRFTNLPSRAAVRAAPIETSTSGSRGDTTGCTPQATRSFRALASFGVAAMIGAPGRQDDRSRAE